MHAAQPCRPEATWSGGVDSRDAVQTLRRVPLISSRAASLRSLPSCRYRPARRWSHARRHLSVADRRPPKQVAYTPWFPTRGSLEGPAPGGGVPVSREMGGSNLRRGPRYQWRSWRAELRRDPVAGASLEVPTRAEAGVPALRRGPVSLSRWEEAPRSEEHGVSFPNGARRAGLRRAPVAGFR